MNITVHTAEEAAGILRCKKSWLESQARQRRIPFTLIGGSYHFTDEHLAEVVRLFEQRPETATPVPRQQRRTASIPANVSPILRARPPRRAASP